MGAPADRSASRHPAADEVEALARPERRAGLSLARLLRLYLHPFALFKDAAVGPPRLRAAALRYNRARRWILLAYLRRWAAIAAACLVTALPAALRAGGRPALDVTFVGLELGFAFALCVLLLAGAAYLLLGAEEPQ